MAFARFGCLECCCKNYNIWGRMIKGVSERKNLLVSFSEDASFYLALGRDKNKNKINKKEAKLCHVKSL